MNCCKHYQLFLQVAKKSFHHHIADIFSFMPGLPFPYSGLPRSPRLAPQPKDEYAASRQGCQILHNKNAITWPLYIDAHSIKARGFLEKR